MAVQLANRLLQTCPLLK